MSEENLFATPEQAEVPTQRLGEVAKLCNDHKDLEVRIAKKNAELKTLNKELEVLSRETIPSIFNDIGLTQIKLESGHVVSIEDKIKASIPNKNYTEAYRNMVNSEGGDPQQASEKIDSLFKSALVIENPNEDIFDQLLELEIPYENKRSIHHMTLNSYCREILGQGKDIPEGISVFQYQETKIK